MKCSNRDIQELLPAFRERVLGDADAARVRDHLTRCRACSEELDVLGKLAEEPVPDPGEAFWAALPDRVFRETQRMPRPREGRLQAWTGGWLTGWSLGGSVALALVLVVAWVVLRPADSTLPPDRPLADASVPLEDLYDPATTVADLASTDIDRLDTWVGRQVEQLRTDLGSEALEPNGTDKPLDEYLSTLDRNDLESLAAKLSRTKGVRS